MVVMEGQRKEATTQNEKQKQTNKKKALLKF